MLRIERSKKEIYKKTDENFTENEINENKMFKHRSPNIDDWFKLLILKNWIMFFNFLINHRNRDHFSV